MSSLTRKSVALPEERGHLDAKPGPKSSGQQTWALTNRVQRCSRCVRSPRIATRGLEYAKVAHELPYLQDPDAEMCAGDAAGPEPHSARAPPPAHLLVRQQVRDAAPPRRDHPRLHRLHHPDRACSGRHRQGRDDLSPPRPTHTPPRPSLSLTTWTDVREVSLATPPLCAWGGAHHALH